MAPVADKVTLWPEQIVARLADAVIIGCGFTVTVVVAVFWQLVPVLVAVTV